MHIVHNSCTNAWILTPPTDMGTITDNDRGNRGHIYKILIRGNGNQKRQSGVDDNESCSVRPLTIMNPVQ
jgi:hypothetical protein